MQIGFFSLWVFKCKKSEISLCTPLQQSARAKNWTFAFLISMCVERICWIRSPNEQKVQIFYIKTILTKQSKKIISHWRKCVLFKTVKHNIKNVLKAILSSKDMNKYLIRPPICKIHTIRCFSYHFFSTKQFWFNLNIFWWQFISAPLCLLSKVWNGEGVSIEFCSIRGEMRRANDILACYSLLISHFRRLW